MGIKGRKKKCRRERGDRASRWTIEQKKKRRRGEWMKKRQGLRTGRAGGKKITSFNVYVGIAFFFLPKQALYLLLSTDDISP